MYAHKSCDNMWTYVILVSFFYRLSENSFKEKVAGISRDPTVHSRDILPKAKRDHLDRIHSDQMALKTITWGRLVLFIGGQEFQSSLKENSKLMSLRTDGFHDSQAGGWSM